MHFAVRCRGQVKPYLTDRGQPRSTAVTSRSSEIHGFCLQEFMNVVRSLPLLSPASQHAVYYSASIPTPAQLSLPIFSHGEMPRKCAKHFPSCDAVLLEPAASATKKFPWIATWAVHCRHQTETEEFRMWWQIQRSSVPFPNLQQCCQTRQDASLRGRSHGSRVRENTRHFGPLFGKAVVRLSGDRTPHGLNHLFQTIRRQGEGRVPGHAGETNLSQTKRLRRQRTVQKPPI